MCLCLFYSCVDKNYEEVGLDYLPVLLAGGENTRIRLLPVSVTYTLPEESMATPHGSLNCPSVVPFVSHFVINVPL